MTRWQLAVCLMSSFVGACSEPQCGANQRRIGSVCRRIPNTDAGETEEDPGAATASDARVDARSTTDAVVDAGAPLEDAAFVDGAVAVAPDGALPELDASSSDPPPVVAPSAVCGDGVLNGAELCDPKIAAGQTGACPAADSCKSDNPCLVVKLAGEATACNARCETETLRACAKDDKCCPEGCTTANDNDCSAKCGNGFVDPGETCELGVGTGCPSSCAAPSGCNAFMLTGSATNCNATCVSVTTTNPMPGDNCCPAGGNAKSDADCAGCGNGKVETGETCDGNCKTSCEDDGNACTIDDPTGSADQCNVACPSPADRKKKPKSPTSDRCCPATYDSSANSTNDPDCAPACENGVIEAGEKCDGNCPNASTCASTDPCKKSALQGTACTRECVTTPVGTAAVDGCCVTGENPTSDPACPGCGNRIIEAGEQCDDGNLLDNDGCSYTCQWQDIIGSGSQGNEIPNRINCGSTTCATPSESCYRVSGATGWEQRCSTTILDGWISMLRCDGAEDCAAGFKCVGFSTENNYTNACASDAFLAQHALTDVYYLYCHKNSDCPGDRTCVPDGSHPTVGQCSRPIGKDYN